MLLKENECLIFLVDSGAYSGPLLPSGKRRFTYSEVSSITNNFDKVIGKGGFGIVYLGSLEDGTEIAVKMINDSSFGKTKGSSSSSSSQVSKEFQVEVLIKTPQNISNQNKMNIRNIVFCKNVFAGRASFDSTSQKLSLVCWILR